MSQLKTIGKNSAALLIAQILSYVLAFFYTLYMARYLGADGYGSISLAISLTGIFGILVDMGLNTLLIREVARDKSKTNSFISNTALMKIFLSLFTLGAIYVFVNLSGYSEQVKTLIYIVYISVVIGSYSNIFGAVMQAEEKMEYLSVSTIISGLVIFFGTLIGIYFSLDVIYFAVLYVTSNGLNFIYISLIYLWKFSFPKIEIDFGFWKPVLKEAWPFGFTSLSGQLYTYVDTVMISLMQGTLVVGWYSAAYRLILTLLFVPTAVNIAIFPVMSRLYTSSKESLILLNERYFKYMLILGIPLGFGTTVLADKIILLIFGAEYTPSIIALQILIWTMVFTFIGASFVQLLQSINKQLILTKISFICLVFNVILNLILIPKYSYIGASVVTLITEIILVSYTIFISFRLGYGIDIKKNTKIFFKVMGGALVMSAFLLYFSSINLFLLVIIAALIYFIIIFRTKTIDDVDKQLFKELIGRS
ncbi:lipopolysaccharide O-side chain biosynthesis protein [Methanobacterium sp. MZ-A1]|uniref:Lipopolysaccharide O-side chain biosynthesis protein n=1 Tax=Methanobacterium subterraneum TaxID=59277 RepID=A0A2H4VEE2_9EURY|nr:MULTISPECIES: flippase [Methanobacterium]AUB56456.1 lipopolysaccharide O-side chain biosynthesis protein [Methanobacterium subterraneum]AUB58674.1 lipopolysaccharide O-side chain biosynthesis protein [Methanobacterium sp. MZ-A1]MBW4257367.1 flippase [Methanobacterium sp. YSL]